MSSSDNHNNTTPQQQQQLGDLDKVLELMVKRSRGEASNAQVEEAVSEVVKVLGGGGGGGSQKDPKQPPPKKPQSTIQQDDGNYDDDDDNDDDEADDTKKSASVSQKPKQEEEEEEEDMMPDEDQQDEHLDSISHIPMGRMGAQMMTTFGDHPLPDPKSLQAALLGTRKCLQVAMFDARALRRHTKRSFDKAKDNVTLKRKGPAPPDAAVQVDHEYRVLSVHDKLSYDPKCGFDVEELSHLYPEEMRSYKRWKHMHESYKKNASSSDEAVVEPTTAAAAAAEDEEEENDQQTDDVKGEESTNNENTVNNNHNKDETLMDDTVEEADVGMVATGHLKERAANFDHRTYLMKKDWYLRFAKVRQGSFLPKINKYRDNSSEQDWENSRTKARGRPVSGSWDNMSAATVQFLHWLGFQPPAMPAPDQETSQVLAFLGYNFLGRIVEKAIFLRNELKATAVDNGSSSNNDKQQDNEETMIMMKLGPKEKLTEADIQRAMDDPDIKPVQLYSGEKLGKPTTQLYFGPGFEDRLEIELEAMLNENKQANDAKEEALRKQEAELLAKISDPPKACDLDEVSRIAGKSVPDVREPVKPARRRRSKADGGQPRKRGRPRKYHHDSAPRKRGRPPKAKAEVVATADEKDENATATSSSPEKKPDTKEPPKVDVASEESSPTKKKRGRPPKPKPDDGDGIDEVPKKKRGRPPKLKPETIDGGDGESPKKKRGRPPKAKPETLDGGGDESSPKKKRGRPPKPKPKPKPESIDDGNGIEESPEKKRGRPPKQPNPDTLDEGDEGDGGEESPKKKRGRPPKAKPETIEGGDGGEEPPKKKRGRPPKPKPETIEGGDGGDEPPKRKRGRPPKPKPEIIPCEGDEPPKRKRGRPRKSG